MAEVDTFTIKLAELLRHPEDLDKIPALKAEFSRKKAAIDAQLKAGLAEQLEVTQSGMQALNESQRIVNQIKEEMMNIDKLCAESQNMLKEFPNISVVSQIHRNFQQVESMKQKLENWNEKLRDIEIALVEDEREAETQPRMLQIHHGLTQLRDFRDEALDQIKQAADISMEETLRDYFVKLDDVIVEFDRHVEAACMDFIRSAYEGNKSIVVRTALIIEAEEKHDLRVQAMQEAQKEHKELVSRFKSIKAGPKQLRGTKERFLTAIKTSTDPQFEQAEQIFLEDPSKLEKSLRWFFNNLQIVKVDLVELMPRKWKVNRMYTNIYHKAMHDFMIKLLDDDRLTSMHILAIIHWRQKYYSKMAKNGWSVTDLQPDLLDDREPELVRDWRQLILNALSEWLGRMFEGDKKGFLERDVSLIDKDANGWFRTKTQSDMWRMLKEQLQVAGASERADVVEGVVEEMFRALKKRQGQWQTLVSDEVVKYAKPGADVEGVQTLQDWMVALANDQISCIDSDESSGRISYLTRFQEDFQNLVSPQFLTTAKDVLDNISDGFVDVGTACISAFVTLVFSIDLRTTISEFFTSKWYGENAMEQIITTFKDYLSDYSLILHPSMLDIFLDELSDTLLNRYLLSVRNKNVKFRRSEPFAKKIADDVRLVFEYFNGFPSIDFETNGKTHWRAAHHMVRFLEVEKALIPAVFEDCKREFWDVQITWIESVLRSRDDFERSMMSMVKTKAGEIQVQRGPETVLGKVK